jgi:hypothetical protein
VGHLPADGLEPPKRGFLDDRFNEKRGQFTGILPRLRAAATCRRGYDRQVERMKPPASCRRT